MELGSSLQSNGRGKEAEGVAPTPCRWRNITFMIYLYKTLGVAECMRWQLQPPLSPLYWTKRSSFARTSFLDLLLSLVLIISFLPSFLPYIHLFMHDAMHTSTTYPRKIFLLCFVNGVLVIFELLSSAVLHSCNHI